MIRSIAATQHEWDSFLAETVAGVVTKAACTSETPQPT
jgi:hypothetical protein